MSRQGHDSSRGGLLNQFLLQTSQLTGHDCRLLTTKIDKHYGSRCDGWWWRRWLRLGNFGWLFFGVKSKIKVQLFHGLGQNVLDLWLGWWWRCFRLRKKHRLTKRKKGKNLENYLGLLNWWSRRIHLVTNRRALFGLQNYFR